MKGSLVALSPGLNCFHQPTREMAGMLRPISASDGCFWKADLCLLRWTTYMKLRQHFRPIFLTTAAAVISGGIHIGLSSLTRAQICTRDQQTHLNSTLMIL